MTWRGWQSTGPTKHSVAKKTPCALCSKVHDSRKEAKRCQDLNLLVTAGEITHLEVHPFYPFIVNGEPVMLGNGHVAGVTLDFSYRTETQAIAEDVKPKSKNADSRDWPLRKAIFQHLYRGITLREVR